VFSSEKLLRIVCMRINLPFYLKIYSTFIRPKLEYDLPVFSCEVVCMGSKKMFLVDAHTAGKGSGNEHADFFEGLLKIRGKYADLLKYQKVTGKGIQSVFSKAVCQVTIPGNMDERALQIFREYLNAYVALVDKARPLSGVALAALRKEFESYLKTVVDHDPGVKGNIMFFGRQGGVERALDIFYGM
ncbi:MAG: hypothetical protein WCQ99_03160, partial [Pseudomonadota bacterium]